MYYSVFTKAAAAAVLFIYFRFYKETLIIFKPTSHSVTPSLGGFFFFPVVFVFFRRYHFTLVDGVPQFGGRNAASSL